MKLRWSEWPSCHERHLQRRSESELFSAARRAITQEMVQEAKAADDRDVAQLMAEVGVSLVSRLDLMGEVEANELGDLHSDANVLLRRALSIGGQRAGGAVAVLEKLIAAIRETLKPWAESENRGNALNELYEHEDMLAGYFRCDVLAHIVRENSPIPDNEVATAVMIEPPDALATYLEYAEVIRTDISTVREQMQTILVELFRVVLDVGQNRIAIDGWEDKLEILGAARARFLDDEPAS